MSVISNGSKVFQVVTWEYETTKVVTYVWRLASENDEQFEARVEREFQEAARRAEQLAPRPPRQFQHPGYPRPRY